MMKQILTTLFLLSQVTCLNATQENASQDEHAQQMTKDIKTLQDQISQLQSQVKNLETHLLQLTNAIGKSLGSRGDIVSSIDDFERGSQALYEYLMPEFRDLRLQKKQVKNLETCLLQLTNAIDKSLGSQGDLVKSIDDFEGGSQGLYVRLWTEFKDIRLQIDHLKQQNEMSNQQIEILKHLSIKK